MNVKTAAQTIRDTVPMEEILSLYGYKTRRGAMCCPFHGDKNPSLKIYPRTGGWHCFGCGRGGSVIDFVMEQEGCSFPTAVRAIDKKLKLGLIDPEEDAMDARDVQRLQAWLDDFVSAVNAYLDTLSEIIEKQQKTRLIMVRLLEAKRDKDVQSVSAGEWDEILKWKDEDQYDEYRKGLIETFREEVAEWRRRARRVK